MSVKNEKNIDFKKILDLDKKTGLLIPVAWKHPYLFRKKDYIAVLIGLNNQYEFERYFCDKIQYELDSDDEKREIGIGFERSNFKDSNIIEEKYSYKENKSQVTRINFWKISILEDGIYGEIISKNEIKEELYKLQMQFYQEIKNLMKIYGNSFVFHSIRSILKQKDELSKNVNLVFFEDFFN